MKGSLKIIPIQICQDSEISGDTVRVEQATFVQNGHRLQDEVSSTGFL